MLVGAWQIPPAMDGAGGWFKYLLRGKHELKRLQTLVDFTKHYDTWPPSGGVFRYDGME
jgi:hypothetical protein